LGLPLVRRPALVEEQVRKRREGDEGGMVLGGCFDVDLVGL
jgi:hypothetical protein